MKKELRKSLVALLTISLIFSCQDSNEVKNVNLAMYNQIGIKHNEMLDVTFYKLKELKDKSSGLLDMNEVLELIKETVIEHTLNSSASLEAVELVTSNVEAAKLTMLNCTWYHQATGNIFNRQVNSEIYNYMTENQRIYYKKISDTFEADDANIESTTRKFNDLEQEIISNCSEEELSALLSSISIARHSFVYWNENATKWKNEFGSRDQNGRILQDPNWKVVGGMDVAGGVTMGVYSSPAVVVPWVGWGFWAGAVASGAAVASISTAVIYWTTGLKVISQPDGTLPSTGSFSLVVVPKNQFTL
jgi:hypothetical protein